MKLWKLLFTVVSHLGLRGRFADWAENNFYRSCLRAHFAGLGVRAFPWWCWNGRGEEVRA